MASELVITILCICVLIQSVQLGLLLPVALPYPQVYVCVYERAESNLHLSHAYELNVLN